MSDNEIEINTAKELRSWLEANYASSGSIWLVRNKKVVNQPYLEYADLVDELLCFGWVDSLPRKRDEKTSMLRISPRNPKSNWSRINKEKVAVLTALGRMHPNGLKLVEIAKTNGCWDFLNDVEDLIIPQDLKERLEEIRGAKENFEHFPDSSKRGILEWIKMAKKPVTRAKRVNETAEKAAINLKANHPNGRDAGPNWQTDSGRTN